MCENLNPGLTIRQEQITTGNFTARDLIYQLGILKLRMKITLEDIAKAESALLELAFSHISNVDSVMCNHCHGSGKLQGNSCEYCNGIGERCVVKFETTEMDLFDCRIYETVNKMFSEDIARDVLDKKTFDSILHATKCDKVDVRPKAKMAAKEFDE